MNSLDADELMDSGLRFWSLDWNRKGRTESEKATILPVAIGSGEPLDCTTSDDPTGEPPPEV